MSELYEVPGNRANFFEEMRFNELENFAERIFDDGRITEMELLAAKQLENNVLTEFLTMGDLVRQMEDTKDKRLPAAQSMLRHLHRCFVLVDYIESRARAERDKTLYGQTLTWERIKDRDSDATSNNIVLGFLMGKTNQAVAMEMGDLFVDSDLRMKVRLDDMKGELDKMPDAERSSLKKLAEQTLDWLLNGERDGVSIKKQLQNMVVNFKQRGPRIA